MGGGSWTTSSYSAKKSAARSAGYTSTFTHTEDIAAGRKAAGVAERLDPKTTNANGEHAGKNIREAMDNDEHPNATPIMVFFDVTGSMGQAPYVLQEKLPQLHGMLQLKGYVEDPQICFGAVGDAYSDRVPLQVGQFESDNRMDDDLGAIFIESGGGGGNHESYELAMYFALYHTHLDIQKKRNGKGYLFLIGDERAYVNVDPKRVRDIIGGVSAEYAETMTTKELVTRLQEKFNVFYLFCEDVSYRAEDTLANTSGYDDKGIGWTELLGQNAIRLENVAAVCETIALNLGVMEGTVTLEDGMEDLRDVGADPASIEAAGKALALVGGGGPVAKTSGSLPGMDDGGNGGNGGTERI